MIPKKLRDGLKLLEGALLAIEVREDGALILRRARVVANPRGRPRKRR